jgi:hypothetical protein
MAAQELYTTPLFSDANLVYYYRLEANSNDAKDSNNGTDTSITYNASYGKFGQGALFNGTSSHITFGSSTPPTNVTLHAWFQLNGSPSNNETIFNWGSGTQYEHTYIAWGASTSYVVREIYDATNYTRWDSATFATDTNYHMIDVQQTAATTPLCYVDGSPLTFTLNTGGSAGRIGSATFIVGYQNWNVDWYFKGNLDDIAIFSRVLTSTEIGKLFNGFAVVTTNYLKDYRRESF